MDKDKPTEETLLDIAEKPDRKAGGGDPGPPISTDSPDSPGPDDQGWSFDEGLEPDGPGDGSPQVGLASGSAALDTAPDMDLSLGPDGAPAGETDVTAGFDVDLSAGFDGSDQDDTAFEAGGAEDGEGFDGDFSIATGGADETPLGEEADTASETAAAGADGGSGTDFSIAAEDSDETPPPGQADTPPEAAGAEEVGGGFGAEEAGSPWAGVEDTADGASVVTGNDPEAAAWPSGSESDGAPAPHSAGSLYEELSAGDEGTGGGGGGGGSDDGDGGGPGKGARGRGKLVVALVAIAVFAAAAVGGVPYWAGMQIEKTYRGYMEEFAESGSVIVESMDYRRGWLSSSVDAVLSTGDAMPVTIEFTSHDRIDHGFAIVADLLTGDLTPSASIEGEMETRVKMGEMTVANLPAVTSTSVMDTAGAGEASFKVAPFSSPPGSPMQVSWNGLSGKMSFSTSPRAFKGGFTVTPLKVDTPEGGLLVRNVMTDFDLSEGPAGLMVGKQVASIGAVEASSDGNSLKIETIMLSGNAAAAGTNMNYSMNERVQKIEYNGRKVGPGNIEIRLRNLDAATLAKLKDIFTEMQKKQLRGEEPGPEMTRNIVTLLAALANRTPSMEIPELTFDTGEGVVDGSLRVVVDGRGKDLAANPAMALAALDVEAAFSVPVSIVNKASAAAAVKGDESPDKAISELVAGGYLVKADGSYKTSVTLKDGRLKVNGRDVENPLPLLMMLGPGASPGVVDPCDDRDPAMMVAGVAPGACAEGSPTVEPGPAPPPAEDEWDDFAAAEAAEAAEPAEGPVVAAPVSTEDVEAPARVKRTVNKEKTYDVAGDIRILSSRNTRWIDRNEAARRLGEAGDLKAVEPLIEALADDPDPFVRRESALSLGRLGDARASGPLDRALDDDDEWVRKYAAEALSDLKERQRMLNAGL